MADSTYIEQLGDTLALAQARPRQELALEETGKIRLLLFSDDLRRYNTYSQFTDKANLITYVI